MMQVEKLRKDLELARKELKNIRQELHKQKAIHERDVRSMKSLLMPTPEVFNPDKKPAERLETYKFQPIGSIESCFKQKNGIPRQSNLCPFSKARLTLSKYAFLNPEHSLIGLEEYSYIWILFIFHKNGEKKFGKTKVRPPRLDGASVGVFSTRSPHRPNAIGLSLIKLERIEGSTLYLSGVDLLDGTPVLDIKPFIPQYDVPDKGLILNELHEFTDIKNFDNNIDAVNNTVIQNRESLMKVEDKQLHRKEKFNNFPYDFCNVPSIAETELFSLSKNVNCHNHDRQESITHSEENEMKGPWRCNHDAGLIELNSLSQKQSDCDTQSCKTINSKTNAQNSMPYPKNEHGNMITNCYVASWVATPTVKSLNVIFTERAEIDLQKFHHHQDHDNNVSCSFCLEFLLSVNKRCAIIDILQNDPRSSYRRKKCLDRLYYFSIDNMHITCWFDDSSCLVEIVRVLPKGIKDVT